MTLSASTSPFALAHFPQEKKLPLGEVSFLITRVRESSSHGYTSPNVFAVALDSKAFVRVLLLAELTP
jgi:hypothetical protein